MKRKCSKEIIKCSSFLFLIVCILSFNINSSKNILDRDVTIEEKIFDTMNDVDNYLNNKYLTYNNYKLTTSHNYGVLAVKNINQTTLGNKYNNLDFKNDLNNDMIIDSKDNLDLNNGICQPVAVTMALRYMVYRNVYSYNMKVNSNTLDEINIFYDIVNSYIKNDWSGGGASRDKCYKSINIYFDNLNVDYKAEYFTNNLMTYVDLSYNNKIPAIAHISGSNGGHAVTICGYYTKTITYQKQVLWWTSNESITYNFLSITTGWYDSVEKISIQTSSTWYENNYSYIDVNDLDGITYIKEEY